MAQRSVWGGKLHIDFFSSTETVGEKYKAFAGSLPNPFPFVSIVKIPKKPYSLIKRPLQKNVTVKVSSFSTAVSVELTKSTRALDNRHWRLAPFSRG